MNMNEKKAIADYKKLSYDLAKLVSQLACIEDRVKFINETMDWDTMVDLDFSSAMCSLARVQAAMTTCAHEDDYRNDDILKMKMSLEAYERS